MDTKEQAAQLRLAAELIETGHPWEYAYVDTGGDFWPPNRLNVMDVLALEQGKIRPALIQPPEGLVLNNPKNLTGEQVGIGWRLTTELETDNQWHDNCEWWDDIKWQRDDAHWAWDKTSCIRVPSSTPWPTIPEPDPFSAIKAGILAGKKYEVIHMDGTWSEWVGGLDFGLRKAAEFREMAPPLSASEIAKLRLWLNSDKFPLD